MKSNHGSAHRNNKNVEVAPAPGGTAGTQDGGTLASVAAVLEMLELLAASPRPLPLTTIARELGMSKARTWRNLHSLVVHGYARQDSETERYEIASKLMSLGESVRERFGIVGAARAEMALLRDDAGHAVTLSALVGGVLTVLEMVQGRTMIEFGIRPGSHLPLHCSAHGHVALAFGPTSLMENVRRAPLTAWTPHTITDPDILRKQIVKVLRQGWATADGQVLVGVNTLAAPVRDHRGDFAGSVAIVGASQFISRQPAAEQIAQVCEAAARISRRLGWGSS
jgi:DNA-binding IclR family transcriptional regulator